MGLFGQIMQNGTGQQPGPTPMMPGQRQPMGASPITGSNNGMMGAPGRPKPRYIDQVMMHRRDEKAQAANALTTGFGMNAGARPGFGGGMSPDFSGQTVTMER